MASALRLMLFVGLWLGLTMGPTATGWAQTDPRLSPLLEELDTRNFRQKAKAVSAIAAIDDPVVVPLLKTLGAGDLYRRKSDGAYFRAVRKGGTFTLYDLVSGDEVETLSKSALDRIIVNNSMRGQIGALLGSLTLRSDDPKQRLSAAQSLLKERDPSGLDALEAAIEAEEMAHIRDVMIAARSAIVLYDTDAPSADRLAAIEALTARGGRSMMSLLSGVAGDPDPTVAEAAGKAAAAIDKELQFWALGQNVWYGLSLGSVLLLAAIGLAITFGVMGVINMAHGELVMLGAYTTFVVQDGIRNAAPHLFDYSLLIAAPLAFVIVGAVGIAIERGVVRFLYGRPLETLLATWGISLLLQQTVRSIFGPTNKEVGNPSWMTGGFELGYLTITYNRLWILVFALAVFAGLLLLLKKTAIGLQMRAVTQNRAMASDMGVRSGMVDALTFGLGAGVAGLAGVALSQIDNVSPNLGQGYIVDSFMVVVFGGAGNLWGALAGAFSLGIANKFLEPFSGAVLAKVLVLVFIILFIQKRPRGLFPLKGRAVES